MNVKDKDVWKSSGFEFVFHASQDLGVINEFGDRAVIMKKGKENHVFYDIGNNWLSYHSLLEDFKRQEGLKHNEKAKTICV